MIVDAVFVIGTGSKNNNEELRYALRNIERHCPFIRDVYIVGECPAWVDTSKVKHIQWGDRFTHAKDANIIDKLRVACEQPDIADNILFCSDDQFQTKQCSWEDFSPRWLRAYTQTDPWYAQKRRLWHSRLRDTLEREYQRRKSLNLDISTIYYYQPHIWMPIDKNKFLEYAKWSDYEHRKDTIIASGYYNYIKEPGTRNFDHLFITPTQQWPVSATHIAYGDSSFKVAMQYLRNTFPEPSKYEVESAENTQEIPEFNPFSPFTDDSLSASTFEAYVYQTWYEPAWESIKDEMLDAERLRKSKFKGWSIVWNDILYRWKTATNNGELIIPVTTEPSKEAQEVLQQCREAVPSLLKVKPSSKAVSSENPPKKKECSSCKKRKELREAQLLKAENPIKETSTHGCIECAFDHLTTAIAYLNTDGGRPSLTDTLLAKGELKVVSTQLLELGRDKEYNRCIEILDSTNLETSLLSSPILKELLTELITNAR